MTVKMTAPNQLQLSDPTFDKINEGNEPCVDLASALPAKEESQSNRLQDNWIDTDHEHVRSSPIYQEQSFFRSNWSHTKKVKKTPFSTFMLPSETANVERSDKNGTVTGISQEHKEIATAQEEQADQTETLNSGSTSQTETDDTESLWHESQGNSSDHHHDHEHVRSSPIYQEQSFFRSNWSHTKKVKKTPFSTFMLPSETANVERSDKNGTVTGISQEHKEIATAQEEQADQTETLNSGSTSQTETDDTESLWHESQGNSSDHHHDHEHVRSSPIYQEQSFFRSNWSHTKKVKKTPFSTFMLPSETANVERSDKNGTVTGISQEHKEIATAQEEQADQTETLNSGSTSQTETDDTESLWHESQGNSSDHRQVEPFRSNWSHTQRVKRTSSSVDKSSGGAVNAERLSENKTSIVTSDNFTMKSSPSREKKAEKKKFLSFQLE